MEALQRDDSPELATALVREYPVMTAPLKAQARDVLVSRPGWASSALAAVETGKIPAADFATDQVRRILLLDDRGLAARAEKLWGQVRPATSREREGKVQAVAGILGKGKGDAARGRPIVAKLCLNCHQFFGEGEKIGPYLTGVDRKTADVLLRNVVDPGGVIREGYQQLKAIFDAIHSVFQHGNGGADVAHVQIEPGQTADRALILGVQPHRIDKAIAGFDELALLLILLGKHQQGVGVLGVQFEGFL